MILFLNREHPYLTRDEISTGALLCGRMLRPPELDKRCTCTKSFSTSSTCSVKAEIMTCSVHRFTLKTRYMLLLSVFGFSESRVVDILSRYQLPNGQITNLDVWIKIVIDDIMDRILEGLLRTSFMQYYEEGSRESAAKNRRKPVVLSSFATDKLLLLTTHFKLTESAAKSFLFYYTININNYHMHDTPMTFCGQLKQYGSYFLQAAHRIV